MKNSTAPFFYVGSKYRYKGNYFGSPSATRSDWFTDGLSIADWWRQKTKTNPEDFTFEILDQPEDITPKKLVELELSWQKKLKVLNGDYFNSAYAAIGFASQPRCQATKNILSLRAKAFWNTEAGILKRARLKERNRRTKSTEMKDLWVNPTKAMLDRCISGRPKGAKDVKPRKRFNKKTKKVMIMGIEYVDAKSASKILKIPYPTITSRCNVEKYTGWLYL